ncbi:MAG TPA: NAD(P)H-dependent oxidoreductase [Ktedonobacterales bacterium]
MAFVVDDVLPPWQPRFIEMRGTVQAFSTGGKQVMPAFSDEFIRLTPTYIVSLLLTKELSQYGPGGIHTNSRKGEEVMNTKPHLLVIFGSTRQGRRGEVIAHWLMDRLAQRSDVTVEMVDLREVALPFFEAPALPAQGPIMPEAEQWAAQVERADGFLFVTPEYNHGYPAVLKNAIDHLYHPWVHKPAAIISYGGFAAGYRAAEQLRQVLIEVKIVPIREQVGISLIPGLGLNISNQSDAPGAVFLDRAFTGMMTELLWWATALIPARARDWQHHE